jgi:hypothetical protein
VLQVVSSTVKPIPPEAIPESNPNSPLTAEPTRRSHPLVVLPPMFTRSDTTFPYRFKPYMRRSSRTDLQWLPKARVPMLAWEERIPPMPDDGDPALIKVSIPTCCLCSCYEFAIASIRTAILWGCISGRVWRSPRGGSSTCPCTEGASEGGSRPLQCFWEPEQRCTPERVSHLLLQE